MQVKAMGTVLFNQEEAPGIFRLRLHCPVLVESSLPGQFVQVKIGNDYSHLLRKPISLHQINRQAGTLDLLYSTVGKGTVALSTVLPNQQVDLVGPLGNGWMKSIAADSPALLVAGGIGVAPMLALAEELVAEGRAVKMFYGARTQQALVGLAEYERLGVDVESATDDGTYGFHGTAVALLEAQLAIGVAGEIYACGPRPMLRAVQSLAKQAGLPNQLSLEEYMACGIGACLGCACAKSDGGYAHVCTDGPVFRGEDVKL